MNRCMKLITMAIALAFVAGSASVFAQRPLGIDVSSHQGLPNWTSVKASGITYAWCKATEGLTFNDASFLYNITNARAAGVLVGAYHYARPDNQIGVTGAQQEAEHFWNVVSNHIKSDGFYMVPVLDIEADLTGAGYTQATLSQWVNAWCSYITNRAASNGIILKPLVYSYVSYSSTWLNSTVTNWPLWMAQYPSGVLNPQTGAPSGTAPWATSNWQFWQYSSTGTVAGVSGNCDLDVFNGTSNGLYAFVIGGVAPPSFISEPSDRYADIGRSITLSASATGGAPLKYQWQLNGTNLPNATNASVTLTNLQTTNGGNYALIVTNFGGRATSSVATLTINSLHTPVFADNFDVNSGASWTLNRPNTDSRAIFAYDYAGIGVPVAPYTTNGTTKGLRFEVNISGGVTNALSVSPTGQGFPTNSRLHFDMWINVNGPLPGGGPGSTEALTAGVGTAGNRVQWNLASALADGVWFAVNGEGGASDTSAGISDFLAYNGSSQQSIASGVYAAGAGSTARGNGDAYYQNVLPGGQTPPATQQSGYPQQTGSLNSGTVGFAWRDVVVSRNGGTVEWFIDGLKIATVTGASLTASNIFVGYWDQFNSISDNTNLSFGLVDNLRVEVPAVAPAITAHPHNLWAQIGSNALFNVTATGVPSPAYQWRLNGTNLAGATTASLLLTNLQGTNAGLYSVVVTNIAGSQTSSNALLSLIASTPPQLQLLGAPAGGSVPLTALGQIGATYALETSTNLLTWQTLTNLVATNTTISLSPSVPADEPQRYYRLRSGP